MGLVNSRSVKTDKTQPEITSFRKIDNETPIIQ